MKTAFLVTVDPTSRDGLIEVGYDQSFREVCRTQIDFAVAQSLIAAFKSLPAGEGDLCFDPVYVVELLENDLMQWSGAACFDCGTFYSAAGSERRNSSFDRFSEASKRLLEKLRNLA